ncbi:MAG: MFS transporter [Ignavibacteriales bacterium]
MNNEKSLKRVLIVATLSALMTPFMGSAMNVAITNLGKDLNGSIVMLNWVITVFLLVSASLLLPFGRLADIYGRKRIFVIGAGIFALATFTCGLAPSLETLIVCRIFQGLGGAMTFSTGMAIVTSAFPPDQRGRVLGINAAAVYVGLSLGPVLGGYLTEYLGWRSIYFTVAAIAAALFLTARGLPDDRIVDNPEKYDTTGAILITLSITALIYGASTITTQAAGPWIVTVGLIGLLLFGFQEVKTKSPLLNIKVLASNTTFAYSNLAALINYMAIFSVSYLMSLYLLVARGFDPHYAGTLLLIQPVVQALISPVAGKMSDKIQPRLVATSGMVITLLGLALLTTINAETDLWLIVFNLALLGLGFAMFSSPNTNAIMSSVDKRYYGIASSMVGTMRLVGQALSMAIVSFIFAHYLGDAKITPAVAPQLLTSAKTAFMVFTGLCLLGVFSSAVRGQVRREGSPAPDPKSE